jgi:peptide/nickel transport system ATP-binding protein
LSVLNVDHLDVTYQTFGGLVPAVRDVSFALERGEVLGLAGESGCGKSTVAHAILRLLPDGTLTSGRVLLGDADVLSMKPGRLRAVRWAEGAIVFQGAMHALNPVRRVGEQIAEPILIHGQGGGGGDLNARVGELLDHVGLPARRARDYPHEFSGGQRQRVMIAMALACDPNLLIADEPTTALDVMVQAQVLTLLRRLQQELGLAMLLITHDLSVLAEVCDRIAVMYAGRIVEEGPSNVVFDAPAHPYTEALAAAFPTIGDPAFRLAPAGLGGDPPDPQAIPPGCPFHPRCPRAFDECPTTEPALFPAGPGQRAACLLVPRGAPTGARA